MNELNHSLLELLGTALVVWVTVWAARRADKKERLQHEQRTEFLLTEYGFHDHTETDGALSVEGIRRPKPNGK